MIVVKLQGGLGNQMFQYALGRHLSLIHDVPLKLDISFFDENNPTIVKRTYDLSIFNIQPEIAHTSEIEYFKKYKKNSSFIEKIFFAHSKIYIQEHQPGFDSTILTTGDNVYLDGYWQSEKYFKDIEKIIQNDFTLKQKPSEHIEDLAQRISSRNSVCINVRRADFVHHARNSAFHGFCDTNYFDAAVTIISQKVSDLHFYIFSDDVDWCRDNLLNRYQNTELIDHSYAGDKFQFYLYLMSLCKHQIIPNSSFGWWAAWLNQNPEKIVIAPTHWVRSFPDKDTIPERWIRISNLPTQSA